MSSSQLFFGRFLIALAAALGPFIPAPLVWACGSSCCSASASQSCCQRTLSEQPNSDSQCPLCRPQSTEQKPAPPCHCHLKARHDSATIAEGRATLDLQAQDQFAVVLVADHTKGASAELMRLALAAGDTIPYRPPRIMFGVWRN